MEIKENLRLPRLEEPQCFTMKQTLKLVLSLFGHVMKFQTKNGVPGA